MPRNCRTTILSSSTCYDISVGRRRTPVFRRQIGDWPRRLLFLWNNTELLPTRDVSEPPELGGDERAGVWEAAFTNRLCDDPSDAEELVNRTFAAVVEGIDDYLEQSAFFGWMCRIMINLNASSHRRRADRDVVYSGAQCTSPPTRTARATAHHGKIRWR